MKVNNKFYKALLLTLVLPTNVLFAAPGLGQHAAEAAYNASLRGRLAAIIQAHPFAAMDLTF